MSTLGSGRRLSSAAGSSAPEVQGTSSSHWAPHGVVLTACVAGINVLVIVLIFVFFWRFFSVKAGPSTSDDGADDEDDDSLPVASPWASRHRRYEVSDLGAGVEEDVASALPVSVYCSSAADAAEEGGKAPECAVCIVELRDGDSVRVLPRCGHRFHADCVGAWLRHHATCPLCRGRVVAPAVAAVSDESRNAKDGGGGRAAAESPV